MVDTTKTDKKPNKKPKSSKKMNPKVKNALVFGSLAAVLIIITVVVMVVSNGKTITYVSNYGEIKTSIVLNPSKLEATFNVEVQGQKVSQKCTYDVVDDDTSKDADDVSGNYELHIPNKTDTVGMSIIDDELTLTYSDGTIVVYLKE